MTVPVTLMMPGKSRVPIGVKIASTAFTAGLPLFALAPMPPALARVMVKVI